MMFALEIVIWEWFILGRRTYVSGEERVAAECTALALVVGAKDDEDVFGGDHEGKGPDDE